MAIPHEKKKCNSSEEEEEEAAAEGDKGRRTGRGEQPQRVGPAVLARGKGRRGAALLVRRREVRAGVAERAQGLFRPGVVVEVGNTLSKS